LVFAESTAGHAQYLAFLDKVAHSLRALDGWVEARAPGYYGVCGPCGKPTSISVRGNAHFADSINLRETCECDCGLIQRGRVLLECALQEFRGRGPIGLFEHGTILHKRLAETHEVISSAYGGGPYRSGETIRLGGQSVQHQDLTALSFADASFAGVMHNDVLEHIADYRRALAECHRVLRPGGSLVFTCPVFLYVASTLDARTHDQRCGRAFVAA